MLNKININRDKQIMIVYALLILVTLAVFGQVNQHDFVNIDDTVYVTKNISIQSGITLTAVRWAFSTTNAEFWHPLTWLSLMLDYELYGLNAGGFHLTNLILHLMSALLLFWLFNRMTGAIWRSAFVAAFFALHPLHVESVAWVAERKDVLSGFFFMLTLCLYVYYTEKPVLRRYLPVLLAFACGLISKSMIVTLPLVLILLDYWPLNRLEFSQNKLSGTKIAGIIPLWQLKEKTPFFVLSAAFAVITIFAQYKPFTKSFPISARIANAPVSFVTYLTKTFWPHDLAVFYPFPEQLPAWELLGAALLILVISVFVTIMVKRMPCLFVGWLWYAITLLPVIGIIQVGSHAMADRYTYLPLIGISIMLAWGIPSLIRRKELRKMILFPAGILFIAMLSFLTWQQCGYWKDSITLYKHALQVTANNDLAHYNLGNALVDQGKIDEALAEFRKSIRINPSSPDAHNNIGVILEKYFKKYAEAIIYYREALRLNPYFIDAHNNLANNLSYQNKDDLAISQFGQALQIDPDNPVTHFNFGMALAKAGKTKEAVDHFRQAISLKPDFAEAQLGLQQALEMDK